MTVFLAPLSVVLLSMGGLSLFQGAKVERLLKQSIARHSCLAAQSRQFQRAALVRQKISLQMKNLRQTLASSPDFAQVANLRLELQKLWSEAKVGWGHTWWEAGRADCIQARVQVLDPAPPIFSEDFLGPTPPELGDRHTLCDQSTSPPLCVELSTSNAESLQKQWTTRWTDQL